MSAVITTPGVYETELFTETLDENHLAVVVAVKDGYCYGHLKAHPGRAACWDTDGDNIDGNEQHTVTGIHDKPIDKAAAALLKAKRKIKACRDWGSQYGSTEALNMAEAFNAVLAYVDAKTA